MINITKEALEFLKDSYQKKFGTLDTFDENFTAYLNLPVFRANENIHEKLTNYKVDKKDLIDQENEFVKGNSVKAEIHWIMRELTHYYLMQAFDAMKVDQTDPNIAINALGKGTPGRIAKMWCGNDPEDTTELLSGRWNKEPALSVFPNDGSQTGEIVDYPISKQVDVVAVCSHHFLPFSSLEPNARVTITYIPKDNLIGISKLQRFADWCASRGWLQEDLCSYIGTTIKRISGSEDVMVEMIGLVHGCEKFRGANTKNGNLTTVYKSGVFKEKKGKVLLNE